MSREKSTAAVTTFKPFQSLSEAGREIVARGLRYHVCKKADTVLQKGQRVSGAFLVVHGKLRVYTIAPNGKESTLYSIEPGEMCVFALNCIFNELLYPAWVEAVASSKVAIIPGAAYKKLFEIEPDVRNMTVTAFSTIVFRLMAELEEINSSYLDRRLTRFLLLHASDDGTVRMTQQEIASHLGSTREVIARLLGRFSAEGYIKTARNKITLAHPTQLAESLRSDGATYKKVAAIRKK